jgi:hypothetical protein
MKPTTDLALVLLGLIAWVVAGLLAIVSPTVDVKRNNGFESTPNIAAAAAAGGFAIAGGLCLLGAALTSKEGDTPKPPPLSGPEADYRDLPG